MKRAKRRLGRLLEMPKDEIVYRLRERARIETDRGRFYLRIGGPEDREFKELVRQQTSIKSYFMHGPAGRFYSGVHRGSKGRITDLLNGTPGWVDRAIAEGVKLLNHRVDILGYSGVNLGTDIDWNRDPISDNRWEPSYWADYDVLNSRCGDPKVIHELNRHQHLPRLAKAFALTGDERFAQEAVSQIEDWIDQNPRWGSINWQSSLEIGLRSLSWLWTIFMLLPSEALDERAARRIAKSFFSQIDHVYRYPSVYSSPNTHLIGEAVAVFAAGLLFPELPRSEKWRSLGAALLIREMERQVSVDGVYAEASSYYHCYATDFFLQAMVLARLNRFPLPEWMWKRLASMLEFVMHMTRPDGSIPLLGDDDGGRVLALQTQDYRTFRDGLSSGAVLLGRPDFKYQARDLAEETLWLLGPDAWAVFDSLSAQPPSNNYRSYPAEGCFFQRSGWGQADTYVTFDCGGLGMLTGGHGHADALSITLFSAGRELLIDPGAYAYNCAPEWRRFFRSTRAHNTVLVDGADQSEVRDTFSWGSKASSCVLSHVALPAIEYVDGEHTGYRRLQNGITHRRRLVHVIPNYWIVLDELRGSGEHEYEFLHHFASNTELMVYGDERKGEVDCSARLLESGLQMLMYASGPVQAQAICGQIHPIQGWMSHRYGERRPSPVLKVQMREQAPAAMMTFLVPGCDTVSSRRLAPEGARATAAVLREREYDDVVIHSLEDAPLRLMDCTMHGEFFWIRMRNGAPMQLLAINANSFHFGAEVVFEDDKAIPYVFAYFWENGMVIERGEHEGKIYVRDLRDRQFQGH